MSQATRGGSFTPIRLEAIGIADRADPVSRSDPRGFDPEPRQDASG